MPGLVANQMVAAGPAPQLPKAQAGIVASQMPAPTAWLEKLREFQSQPWAPAALAPEETPKFREWLFNTKLFNSIKQEIAEENKIPLDRLNNERVADMLMQSKDYDYVKAWRAGIREEISPHDGKPHWPSKTGDGEWLKSPKHETSWKEVFMQQYGKDPDDLGLHQIDDAIQWSKQGGGQ